MPWKNDKKVILNERQLTLQLKFKYRHWRERERQGEGTKYSRRPYACWILRTSPALLPLHIWLGFSKHFSVSFPSFSPSLPPSPSLSSEQTLEFWVFWIYPWIVSLPSELSARICCFQSQIKWQTSPNALGL